MSFKVGDRVRIVCPGSRFNGEECTVTEEVVAWLFSPNRQKNKYCRHYRVDRTHPDGYPAGYEGHELRPIYDDPELGSWQEIEKLTHWNPTGVTA